MKKIILMLTFCYFTLPLFAESIEEESVKRVEHYNLKKKNLAIKGYDPVSYFKDKPQKGTAKNTFLYKGLKYHFVSEENLNDFKKNPEKYEPAFGGWCAYAMIDGDKVDINPMTYKIINDKNYLFYDALLGDTLKRWNKKVEETPEAELVLKAQSNWEELLKNNE